VPLVDLGAGFSLNLPVSQGGAKGSYATVAAFMVFMLRGEVEQRRFRLAAGIRRLWKNPSGDIAQDHTVARHGR
jgi:hypothetical protein